MSTLGQKEIHTPKTILVVEDDQNILNLLSAYLESAGHKVVTATDGDQGLENSLSGDFDICILDVMLPQKSGIEIASAMRENGNSTPILFLTALGNEDDILQGFGVGADDYMVKPFSPRELLVRIEAILRRQSTRRTEQDLNLEFGAIQLDNAQHRCQANGESVELTPHEYRILRQLLSRPNQVFERRSLIANIYGNENAVSPKAIDVHVHHLRFKLGDQAGEMIQTVRGFGYRFSPANGQVRQK
ncbi:MAG: DNA-binding response regulator [Rhodospirillaceae bacterium]|nr:DNA-binding response regulator [Rhodospirillaceae bacterium]|tara:strand:- start:323 stop:1057 length:735 start_codon:yes stop_codon:yes gene_type:complete